MNLTAFRLIIFTCQIFIFNMNYVRAWSVIQKPLNYFDLSSHNNLEDGQRFIYEYINILEDKYRVLKKDKANRYLVLGARNRIITISIGDNFNVQTKEYDIPRSQYESDYPEYILAMVPFQSNSDTNRNNMLVCKTGPKCVHSQFDEVRQTLFGHSPNFGHLKSISFTNFFLFLENWRIYQF